MTYKIGEERLNNVRKASELAALAGTNVIISSNDFTDLMRTIDGATERRKKFHELFIAKAHVIGKQEKRIRELEVDLRALKAENERLRKALAVYAHKGYWIGTQFVLVPMIGGIVVAPYEIATRALEANDAPYEK